MTEINLLPWREARREQEKKNFTTMILASLVIAVCVVFLVNQYASSLVGEQTRRNEKLQSEINRLDAQIVEIKKLKLIRDSLISRMKIVHSLLTTRILTVHLFDELIKILPDGVYLTEVKRAENRIIVQGYSESNTNVSILMRNIQHNPWIQDPVLTDIKKAEDKTGDTAGAKTVSNDNEFNLSFVLKPKTKNTSVTKS